MSPSNSSSSDSASSDSASSDSAQPDSSQPSSVPTAGTSNVPAGALDAFRLDGKTAVLTGVASGIGAATAELFAQAGANVVGGDINEAAGRATVDGIGERLGGAGGGSGAGADAGTAGQAIFAETDVTRREDVDALVDRALGEFGRVDIVANIAGAMFPGLMEDVKDDQIDAGIDLNLRSVIYGCQAGVRAMKDQGSGVIINVSSGAIDLAYEGIGIYAFTKASVAMLTMTLAKEVGKYGIRVNAIAPGSTLTPFTTWRLYKDDGSLDQSAYDEFIEFAKGMSPLGVYGEALDQAYLMLYLASEAGRFCHGNIFRSNGGQTMMW